METTPFEQKAAEGAGEAFFARAENELRGEKEKLIQMDGDKEVSRENYKSIERQAKLVAFLSAIKESANLYAEAEANNDAENLEVMKRYLNI